MTPIDVSVVVCTYNRADMLDAALRSLAQLKTDGRFDYEIVVVDNASTDHTPEVVERFASWCPVHLVHVVEREQGISAARNRGVHEARGQWIAYFDDDQAADPGWLAGLIETAGQTGARCVGGAVHLALPEGAPADLPQVCRRMLGESLGPAAPCPYNRSLTPGTNNLMLHRSLFDEVGLFDKSLAEGGEDADLLHRMRLAEIDAWYTPRAVVYHIIPEYRLSPAYFRWTNLRHGGHIARRDRQLVGPLLFPLAIVARLAQAALLYLPSYLSAVLRRSPGRRLGARCLLWRSEGFVRHGFQMIAPRLFAQSHFFGTLVFRKERETLAQQPTGSGYREVSCTK